MYSNSILELVKEEGGTGGALEGRGRAHPFKTLQIEFTLLIVSYALSIGIPT